MRSRTYITGMCICMWHVRVHMHVACGMWQVRVRVLVHVRMDVHVAVCMTITCLGGAMDCVLLLTSRLLQSDPSYCRT